MANTARKVVVPKFVSMVVICRAPRGKRPMGLEIFSRENVDRALGSESETRPLTQLGIQPTNQTFWHPAEIHSISDSDLTHSDQMYATRGKGILSWQIFQIFFPSPAPPQSTLLKIPQWNLMQGYTASGSTKISQIMVKTLTWSDPFLKTKNHLKAKKK